MKRLMRERTVFAVIILALFAFPPQTWAQSAGSTASTAIIKGIAGETASTLTGDALTSLGLNIQNSNSAFDKDVTTELQTIIDELNEINSDLESIKAAIQNQTCVAVLTGNQLSGAIDDIQNVDSAYLDLLNNATNTAYTITQNDIDDVVSKMGNLQADLTTINTQMQLAGTLGIIGQCSLAVYDGLGNGTGLPMSTQLGGDMAFYSDMINLMNYLANIQAEGTMLLVEYYNYQAFKNSDYYSSSGVAQNPLTADNAKAVCITPTSAMTELQTDNCLNANDQLQQLYAYLQNQFTASGVPYTTYDSKGNMITGVWAGPPTTDSTPQNFYLFVTSLEDFTKAEDPDSGCTFPLQSTSATSPCGITASDTPGQNPFGSGSSQTPYGFVSGWHPASAAMWSSVLAPFDAGGTGGETAGTALQNAGFANTNVSKIIETPDFYYPNVQRHGHDLFDQFATKPGGVCFIDTNLSKSLPQSGEDFKQPVCFNGNESNTGNAGPLLDRKGQFKGADDKNCLSYSTNSVVVDATQDPQFYQKGLRTQINGSGKLSNKCPGPGDDQYAYWLDGVVPGWIWNGGTAATSHKAFFWPALDLTGGGGFSCSTNYKWDTQSAITRTLLNSVNIPTMCNEDFNRYIAADVDPINSFRMFAFLNSPVSGSGGTSATLGPFTIQMQSTTYGQETPTPLTLAADTVVTLSSTSPDGVFSLSYDGPAVTTVTIPAGDTTATFYYGDPNAGTPVISASTGAINSAFQNEEILSSYPSADTVGRVNYRKAGRHNSSLRFRGRLQLPRGVKLNQVKLTLVHMLSEDSGLGELVQGPGSTSLNFPLTLMPAPGSTPTRAIFRTRPGVKPRLVVKIKARRRGRNAYWHHNPARSEFLITLRQGDISTPTACSRSSKVVTLHTKLTVGDGTHAPASFNSQIDWQCVAHGLVTPTDTNRRFGGVASLQ